MSDEGGESASASEGGKTPFMESLGKAEEEQLFEEQREKLTEGFLEMLTPLASSMDERLNGLADSQDALSSRVDSLLEVLAAVRGGCEFEGLVQGASRLARTRGKLGSVKDLLGKVAARVQTIKSKMARSSVVSSALQAAEGYSSKEGRSGEGSAGPEGAGEFARTTSASGAQLFGNGEQEEGFVSARVAK